MFDRIHLWSHLVLGFCLLEDFFFLKDFFDVDDFLSLYCICYSIASVLHFGFFGHEACGILAPQPGIEPAPPALEGEVLTTGPPGKSLLEDFLITVSISVLVIGLFIFSISS